MTRAQRRTIESHFYNYEKERNECADYISSRMLAGMGMDYSKEKVCSSHGNAVEDRIIKTLDDYNRKYQWCIVYEKTLERVKWTQKDKLMQMRYIDKNHQVCICDVIGISDRTLRYWVEDILNIAFMWAQEFNLL